MLYISLATNFPCFPISLAARKRGGKTKGRGTSEGKRKSFIRKTTERGRESVYQTGTWKVNVSLLLLLFFIYCGCNKFNLLKRVVTFFVTLLFSEEEGTRNGKEEERKRREG